MTITIIGIDPGLVHTGMVAYRIDPSAEEVEIWYRAYAGEYVPGEVLKFKNATAQGDTFLFVEDYRPRGNTYSTDPKMRELISSLRGVMPKAVFLDNMGVKKIVTPKLMKHLGVPKFPTTHHQDLESAVRIGLFGALKNAELNPILAQVAIDSIDGTPWTTKHEEI